MYVVSSALKVIFFYFSLKFIYSTIIFVRRKSTIFTWNTMNGAHFRSEISLFSSIVQNFFFFYNVIPLEFIIPFDISVLAYIFFPSKLLLYCMYCLTHKFSLFLVPIDYIEASQHAPIFFHFMKWFLFRFWIVLDCFFYHNIAFTIHTEIKFYTFEINLN